jgi:hypothetical protein
MVFCFSFSFNAAVAAYQGAECAWMTEYACYRGRGEQRDGDVLTKKGALDLVERRS